jgi:hypothetical protein
VTSVGQDRAATSAAFAGAYCDGGHVCGMLSKVKCLATSMMVGVVQCIVGSKAWGKPSSGWSCQGFLGLKHSGRQMFGLNSRGLTSPKHGGVR